VIGSRIRNMEEAHFSTRMEIDMMDTGLMGSLREKEE
jgi:hypothetical protein